MVTAIILASGKGVRMGMESTSDKCFLSLGAQPVLAWSLLAFEKCAAVDRIIIVVRKGQTNAARGVCQMFGISKVTKILQGGSRRQDSVYIALQEVDQDMRFVTIHDAARPCVTSALISETIKHARRCGSGVAGHPVIDTIKVVGKGFLIQETLPRETLWAVQTPQTFLLKDLIEAYHTTGADQKGNDFTDDASILEATGVTPRIVECHFPNPKITIPEDLSIAAAILKLV